jgi:zinc transport system permease protein
MEMFHYEFMQRAFWAGTCIAILGPLLGVFLMLRRQAMLPDTLAHISLAGIALGLTLKTDPLLTAIVIAVGGALLMEWLRRSYRSYSEMSVAILMTGGLSIAVLLMSVQQSINKGFTAYLFGSIVAIHTQAIVVMTVITIIGLLMIWWYRRPLYLMTFDEDCARTSGVSVNGISIGFNLLTGIAIAVILPITGVLLVSALVILPAALATRIGRTFAQTMIIAVAVGLFGVYSGLSLSYVYNTPSGASIALVLLICLISGLVSQYVGRKIRRRRLRNEGAFPVQPSVSIPQPISPTEQEMPANMRK